MLCAQLPEYIRFFYAFPFDENSIAMMLAACQNDIYYGAFADDRLVGFFMLRGWDEDYNIPAFGVVVDQEFNGYGISSLGLEMAKSLCRLRKVERIMLKVNPENIAGKTVYERAGFLPTETESLTGNIVYYYDIKPNSRK